MAEKAKTMFKYTGKEVDVFWDGALCIHIGECSRASGDLFVGGREPWCQPDLTTTEDTVDVVRRCPTGALTYLEKDGGSAETAASRNVATVVYNGPLYVRGNLHIEGAEDREGVRFRAALCRCGESKNKPFCDNSHEKADFRDYGAVGATGDGLEAEGGMLEIRMAPNGPIIASGNLTITASSGREAWKGTSAALCRCGASDNKPFCDGSHKRVGFEAD